MIADTRSVVLPKMNVAATDCCVIIRRCAQEGLSGREIDSATDRGDRTAGLAMNGNSMHGVCRADDRVRRAKITSGVSAVRKHVHALSAVMFYVACGRFHGVTARGRQLRIQE